MRLSIQPAVSWFFRRPPLQCAAVFAYRERLYAPAQISFRSARLFHQPRHYRAVPVAAGGAALCHDGGGVGADGLARLVADGVGAARARGGVADAENVVSRHAGQYRVRHADGLGAGALWVRSLTVYLVRAKTLGKYQYLEHGAHWAILALGVIMLVKLYHVEPPEWFTGSVGLIFIATAIISSILESRLSLQKSSQK